MRQGRNRKNSNVMIYRTRERRNEALESEICRCCTTANTPLVSAFRQILRTVPAERKRFFLSTIFNNSEDNSFWNCSQGTVREEFIAVILRKVCRSSDTINIYRTQTPSVVTLVNDQLDAQFFYFIIRLLQSSTCFEQRRAHHQEVKLY